MATGGNIITDQGAYFVRFAVVGWVDVFTRKDYRVYTPYFAAQKLEYIHNNSDEAGIVEKLRNIFTVVQEIIILESNADY